MANPAEPDSPALRALLEGHEGRRALPYRDSLGKLTIGVGRNLSDRGLSEGEIDLLLANDIAIAAEACGEIFGPGFVGLAEPRRRGAGRPLGRADRPPGARHRPPAPRRLTRP